MHDISQVSIQLFSLSLIVMTLVTKEVRNYSKFNVFIISHIVVYVFIWKQEGNRMRFGILILRVDDMIK